ncbi:MAG TPA: hypothetical protein VIE43_07535 [Thermoanaerobaculia bacterium]|jgi:hypothetical protein|nr:hypothetical protein [Thermoanaerobaculia bacterium]
MRKLAVAAAMMLAALPVFAHVTPNVELLKKGEFIRQSLPAATKFLELQLALSATELATVKNATGWTPSAEEAKLYVGRDDQGGLLGRIVLLWIPSMHGPVGVAVAFDSAGKILRVAVTDIGSEPLAWVRPLLDSGGLAAFIGLSSNAALDPAKIAPQVTGTMSRYFAKVITDGVARAQALDRVVQAAG